MPVINKLVPIWQTTDNETVRLFCGDVLKTAQKLPGQSIQCIVTSPPYWNLRDYGTNSPDELGSEKTPEEYIAKMVLIFRELRRVLRNDGTVWLNLGDSYEQGGQLVGIPWRVALALQADGWILRQDILWIKRDPMPESVQNRCTKAHEYIFLLTKSMNYYYDHYAIKEESVYPAGFMPTGSLANSVKRDKCRDAMSSAESHGGSIETLRIDGTRNKRSWWDVTSGGYPGLHFACFPEKLIEPCILAGTSEYGCCARCGEPYKRIVERRNPVVKNAEQLKRDRSAENRNGKGDSTLDGEIPTVDTVGWEKQCICTDDNW